MPYHAGVRGGGLRRGGPIKDSFLNKEENRIKMISYKNEHYDPDDPDSLEYFSDGSLPFYRAIKITEQALLNDAFDDVPVVDFETRMVLIIIFSTFGNYQFGLKDMEQKNDILELTVINRQRGIVTAPELVYLVIQLDKLDISDIVVSFTK